MKIISWFIYFLLMLLLIVAMGLLLSLPVMWLWNTCLVPAVDGVHEIGILQAWGITFLIGILFNSMSTAKKD